VVSHRSTVSTRWKTWWTEVSLYLAIKTIGINEEKKAALIIALLVYNEAAPEKDSKSDP